MWDLLRTRRWISFTLTAIAAIVAFGVLSSWQWDRAHEEELRAEELLAGAAAGAVPIGELIGPGTPLAAGQQWRTVTVDGVLDCSRGFLVRNRPLNAVNGLWAVCPLLTDDGAVLWVNRGWLPAPGPATSQVPIPVAVDGAVTVTGRLRASQDGPPAPPSDLPARQVTHLDTDVLTSLAGLGTATYDPYLDATAMAPADPAALTAIPLPATDSAQNYSYAGQWLLFAVITMGGWYYFLRREAREEAAAAPAADGAAATAR